MLPTSPSGCADELLGVATEAVPGDGARPDTPTAAAILPGTVIGIPPPPGEGVPIGITALGAIDEIPATVAMAAVADGRTLALGKPTGEGVPIGITARGANDEMPPTVAVALVADEGTLPIGKAPGEGCPIWVTLFDATDELRPSVGIPSLDSEEGLAAEAGVPAGITRLLVSAATSRCVSPITSRSCCPLCLF